MNRTLVIGNKSVICKLLHELLNNIKNLAYLFTDNTWYKLVLSLPPLIKILPILEKNLLKTRY